MKELAPLEQAIVSRSLIKLEDCISNHPRTLSGKVFNFTPIQLCITWPKGLRRLLELEAQGVVPAYRQFKQRNSPIALALRYGNAESVDLLMNAKCYIGSGVLSEDRLCGSLPSLEIFVSHLARRRRELLSVAQEKLGSLADFDQSQVIDEGASILFKALTNAGATGISHLSFNEKYATVFHHPGVRLDQFPIFYENGFRDCRTRDHFGRTAIMVTRRLFWTEVNLKRWKHPSDSLAWLDEHGFMDQTAKDTLRIGINEAATGWDYLAIGLLSNIFRGPRMTVVYFSPTMEKLSEVRSRDNCVCWCSSPSRGCSPLQSFWKSIPWWVKRLSPHRDRASRAALLGHLLFHRSIKVTKADSEDSCDQIIELVRLLTFEALGMTHTCCSLKKCKPWELAIVNCPPGKVRDVQSKSEEQHNARVLEDLMLEFTHEVKAINPSMNLEIFIWGYWRRRISKLFAVDGDTLANMRMTVHNIQTCEYDTPRFRTYTKLLRCPPGKAEMLSWQGLPIDTL